MAKKKKEKMYKLMFYQFSHQFTVACHDLYKINWSGMVKMKQINMKYIKPPQAFICFTISYQTIRSLSSMNKFCTGCVKSVIGFLYLV